MIARILYRESVHGILNYVFEKANSKILGYKNVSPELQEFPNLLKHHLYFLGNRHDTKKRYVHITLNLPHGEYVSDKTFFEIAEEYMNHMGYGEQPFTVVRHDDTKHEHVHIVTTTVKEDNSLINTSNDFLRNRATQKYLEEKFGLQESPDIKTKRALEVNRFPELSPIPDDSNGVKFYIQDILNTICQRDKPRSFGELAMVLKPYHILVSTKESPNGRIGVSYGIEVQNGYKSRFINGYIVHPDFSGPKMEFLFKRNRESKLIPMHRMRLEKQLTSTLDLFKSINQDDIIKVLEQYQKIGIDIDMEKKFTIHDKSGYHFSSHEFRKELVKKLSDKIDKGPTSIDLDSKQFQLELVKLVRDTLFKMYLELDNKNVLLSKFMWNLSPKFGINAVAKSENLEFFSQFVQPGTGQNIVQYIEQEYQNIRTQLCLAEHQSERKDLEDKSSVLKKALSTNIFTIPFADTFSFELVQSLGLKYNNGKIGFMNSNEHELPLVLNQFKLPANNPSYVSTGFIKENQRVLEFLTSDEENPKANVKGTAFFLPVIFPRIYDAMAFDAKVKFEGISMSAYLKYAERQHKEFEKSPVDYIHMMNHKGFYIEPIKDKLYLKSIYTSSICAIPISRKVQSYLKSTTELEKVLGSQKETTTDLIKGKRDNLESLWLTYLIEKELYKKAAFMVVYDGIRPNMAPNVLENHMANGLKQKIFEVSQHKVSFQHQQALRKGVYAFSSLMGNRKNENAEVFNGFKDELSDYSKFKNIFN